MKKILLFLISLILVMPLSFSIKPVAAESQYFSTTADTHVRSNFPDTNSGGGTQLFLFNQAYGQGRLFLKFDLSVIPAGSTTTGAWLKLKVRDACTGDELVPPEVSLVENNWEETAITWNNQPGVGNHIQIHTDCNLNQYGSWPITSIVNEITTGAHANFGFQTTTIGTPYYTRTYYSREMGADYIPKLYIQYTPPATPTPQPSGGSTDTGSTTTGTTTGTSQPGITAGTKAAPATKTSTAIKPPSELSAVDAGTSKTPSINLSWKKSETTNIDGYKIFRSEKETEGFENIANSDKNTLTYTDTVSAEKTYYYMVRAYKGNEESASSNTASASAKKFMEEKAPTTEKPATLWQKILERRWLILGIAGGIVVLALAGILLYKFWWLKKKTPG